MAKKSGGFLTTFVLAVVVVIASVVLGVGVSRFDFMASVPLIGPYFYEERPATTTTGPTVIEGIQDLDELATVRWTESVPVTRESGGTRFEQIFSGERVLLIATGEVEAGLDLSEIGEGDVNVNEEANTVTIDLPRAKILDVSLDEEQTEVYDRDFSPLNVRPDDDLVEEARAAALTEIENAARENDILDQAEANAEDSIRAFVTTLGFEEVRFE